MKGDYPKTFKFTSWHVQCRCHVIDILATEDEFINQQKKILAGEKNPVIQSENEVTDLPKGFTNWVADNKDRISAAKENGTLPYFLRDNEKSMFIDKAKSFAAKFNDKSKNIANEIGCFVTNVNIKSLTRTIEKSTADYAGDVTLCKDIIRNTFVVTDNKIENTIKKISEEFDVDRIKRQSSKLGYRGTIINVKTSNNTFAEIQVTTPQVIYGKSSNAIDYIGEKFFTEIKKLSGLENGLGHKLYEEWRKLDALIPLQSKRMKEIEKLSSDYYSKLRNLKL
ncbi:MAG: hypothetical protein Q7U47_08365 [Paludibacter sp.]|nr:hypothetical protein [Paludibacter sp.]